ncbi:MAG: hypothetical protein Fur0043_18070 [Anaerolineales bacterium]
MYWIDEITDRLVDWQRSLSQDDLDLLNTLPLRQDMVTFLNYLKENKVTGTQSRGNLPLKDVRAVCARFVNPPELDTKIGDYIYKLRSEDDVFPLFFLHTIAFTGVLITGGPARKLRVTVIGEKFLKHTVPMQVGFMGFVWWYHIDWRVAYQVTGLSDGLPRGFQETCLKRLLEVPLDRFVSFDAFADRLVEDTGLSWPSLDQSMTTDILRYVIERLLIEPMKKLAVLQCKYIPNRILGLPYKELVEIKLTHVGKGLLQTLE